MHTTRHRLGLLSLIPFAAFAAFFLAAFLIAMTAGSVGEDSFPITILIAFGVVAVLLIASVVVYIRFLVHVARRTDFTPSDKAMWVVLMFVAGPLGPPVYWFATLRPRG